MKNKSLICSLALIAFVVFSGPAKATLLPPGSGPVAPDVFNPAYTTELATVTTAFVTPGALVTGSVTTSVFSGPNFFGANNLSFVYQVTNSTASLDSILRTTAVNFTGFMTDVGYTATGSALVGGHFVNGTIPPNTVDRFQMSGDTVGFNFLANPITPGSITNALIIETNATQFTAGFFNVIDGGVAQVPAFQPTAPDGGSAVALLGIALAGLEGVRRMFRARKS